MRSAVVAKLGVHVGDDLAEGAQAGHDGGVEFGQGRDALAHGGEDLDALDGIDAEVGVERHARFEHLAGIAGLLGDDGQHDGVQRRGDGVMVDGRLMDCSGGGR